MGTGGPIGVGVVSPGWMGRLRARSHRSLPERIPAPGPAPRQARPAGRRGPRAR